MRHSTPSLRTRRPSAIVEAVDIDVTPVMNMFIILIPFLISMSAFVHLATHTVTLPGDAEIGIAVTAREAPLVVAVGLQGLEVTQGDLVLARLPRLGDVLDLAGLKALLSERAVVRAVLAIDDPITTGDIVACLDACREAGCLDLGLAAGVGVAPAGEVLR